MKRIFCFFCFFISFNSFANNELIDFFGTNSSSEIKFGGWSNHFSDNDNYFKAPLNETHRGIGFEYYREIKNYENHFLGTGIWYMNDSFDADSIQLSLAYKYRWNIDYIIDSIDFNLNIGVVNRSFRTFLYEEGSNDTIYEGYEDERETQIITAPIITLNFLEHMQFDFTYLPESIAEHFSGHYGLFFCRFGYKF